MSYASELGSTAILGGHTSTVRGVEKRQAPRRCFDPGRSLFRCCQTRPETRRLSPQLDAGLATHRYRPYVYSASRLPCWARHIPRRISSQSHHLWDGMDVAEYCRGEYAGGLVGTYLVNKYANSSKVSDNPRDIFKFA